MRGVPTGVSIITTTSRDGPPIGLTVNSLASLSLDPPLVTWALRLQSPLVQAFRERGAFIVHLLACDQEALSRRFASPDIDRFAGMRPDTTADGLPRLAGAAAYLECVTHSNLIVGDHVLFVGSVRAVEVTGRAALGYCAGEYFALRS